MPATALAISITAGLSLGGASLTPAEDLAPSTGIVGHAILGPAGLLRELELRLGLIGPEPSRAVRLGRWSMRIARLLERGASPFFAKSFNVDPVGTSDELLRWRDLLVEAGWDGQAVGAPRLDDISGVEGVSEILMPNGPADRLAAVERALSGPPDLRLPYDKVELVEDRDLWPFRWQRVFSLLEARGIEVTRLEPAWAEFVGEDDLSRLKRRLITEDASAQAFEGDGSVIALRAETPAELAAGIAALLRRWGGESTVVVRGGDRTLLDGALLAQGHSSQGDTPDSRYRPLLQILPLALELAFEPKDPRRVMELLTLPDGPFRGRVGRTLSRALAEAPGIGGPRWVEARNLAGEQAASAEVERCLAEDSDEKRARAEGEKRRTRVIERIERWIEAPGAPPTGAPRPRIVEVAAMVKAWAATLLATTGRDDGLSSVVASTQVFLDAVSNDPSEDLSQLRVRHLLDDVLSSGRPFTVSRELAGRIDHVDSPASLLVPRDTVLWWGFDDAAVSPIAPPPFSKSEVEALGRAGVSFVNTGSLAVAAARSWRQAILAANRRVILAWPRSRGGEETAPHPLWDEISVRSKASAGELSVVKITLDVADLAAGRPTTLLAEDFLPELATVEALDLPETLGAWTTDSGAISIERLSVTRLESLIGCPLKWVLADRAKITERRTAQIQTGPRLYGNLAHRLIEELFAANALSEESAAFDARAQGLLADLIRTEGATLLLDGSSQERRAITLQILNAARALNSVLRESRLEPVAVEESFERQWAAGDQDRPPIVIAGKVDLVCRSEDGRESILDLKWGRKDKETLLAEGKAVQLAAYAFARTIDDRPPPATAFFSIMTGHAMTTEDGWLRGEGARPMNGPSAPETWHRVEESLTVIRNQFDRGAIPVFGLKSAPRPSQLAPELAGALLDLDPEAPCRYCAFDSLCGKRWEGLSR